MLKRLIILSLSISFVLYVAGSYLGLHKPGRKITNRELAEATVTITNEAETSGGTGVILSSNETFSKILTNNHICELVKRGGAKVITDSGMHTTIVGFVQSNLHDMCVLIVPQNLEIQTLVSSRVPRPYEELTISGHPSLLPTIITHGHFSHKIMGTIQIGTRPCTSAELNSPYGFICIFGGGMPILRSYEMQVVSATIMPGSSGSAVYNSDGEISGLVFAGRGELGYGFIVPHEYLLEFLNAEIQTLAVQVPPSSVELKAEHQDSNSNKQCKKLKRKKDRLACELLVRLGAANG